MVELKRKACRVPQHKSNLVMKGQARNAETVTREWRLVLFVEGFHFITRIRTFDLSVLRWIFFELYFSLGNTGL
jgi:hypothetical protein